MTGVQTCALPIFAREQARKDLPLSTYTEAYWKCNLHNLLHFLALRMEAGAQLEIRDYATTIGREIVSRWSPSPGRPSPTTRSKPPHSPATNARSSA